MSKNGRWASNRRDPRTITGDGAIYLGGSRSIHPVLRGAALAGAMLSLSLAVLTQSRGAMVALAVSLPVYFLLSGQRLRGLLALAPVALALFVLFPDLNRVYLVLSNGGDIVATLHRVLPTIWFGAGAVGLFGLCWGLADATWRPPTNMVRVVGGAVLVGCLVAGVIGANAFVERVGEPAGVVQQKWEAFKANDKTGVDQSRYLSMSGSGRYTSWRVAWEDFSTSPVLGVGTHNWEATYYQLRERTSGSARQPHSLPLEVLSERGVVGGALFFGFLGVCVAGGLPRRFTNLNQEGKAQVGALVAVVAYWFVHSSAEWFWQMPAVTLPAIVYLALLAAPWRIDHTPYPLRWPLRAGGVGVGVLAVLIVAPLYVADRGVAHTNTTEDPKQALVAVEQAQRYNPLNPRLALREAELARLAGEWDRAKDAYERAIRLNPEHDAPYAMLAESYEVRGRGKEALEYYRRALSLNPHDHELKQKVKRLQGTHPR